MNRHFNRKQYSVCIVELSTVGIVVISITIKGNYSRIRNKIAKCMKVFKETTPINFSIDFCHSE